MITAIAIDDEPEAIDILKFHASKLEYLNIVNHFYKPQKAIDYLRNNQVDLIFLDVNMPEISGIELLRKIKVKPLVVFTTAYEKYAVESYKFNAIDYLLKPIDFEDFQTAMNKVKKAVSNIHESYASETFIFIKDGTKTIKLFYADIALLKGCGNYVEFITKSKKYSSRITITQLIEKLPRHIFERVHNSFIINIEKIDKIEHNQITLGNNKASIGESYRNSFNIRIRERLI